MSPLEKQTLILACLRETIKPENTGWMTDITPAVKALDVIKPGGWMMVRNCLQYLMDQGEVERAEFNPYAPDEYYVAVSAK